jgi:hypothetical protein
MALVNITLFDFFNVIEIEKETEVLFFGATDQE